MHLILLPPENHMTIQQSDSFLKTWIHEDEEKKRSEEEIVTKICKLENMWKLVPVVY